MADTSAARIHWNAWTEGQLEKERRDARDRDRVEFERRVVEQFRALGIPEGSALLDVGVGAGWITRELYKRYEYTGLDLSDLAISAARNRCPDANLTAVDFLTWSMQKERFDAVLCVDTVAYFDQQQGVAVRKMHDALKPNGVLVMTTVNPFIYSRFEWRKGQKPMGKWLTRSEFLSLVESQGFRIESYATIVPAGDQGWLRALNSRKLKTLLGRPYVSLLERLNLGQYQVVVARRR
jgi:2-polyprenyl-3-methyl-5-hydroxy-6-metoxy-1,4-benzoquinol methylase